MDRKKPASLESAVEAQNSPDTFTYNGLGLRVGKSDSTGTYAYVCDGTTPGAPVLSDAHAVYNPGLSEDRAGVVTYSDNDALGNLWTLDAGAGDSTPSGCLYTAFGSPILTSNLATPFRYGGASGCQTDADTGLVLMGHRYYDSRIGRFISQDPIGDGTNWYAYCGNNPINATDPSGNVPQTLNGGSASINSEGYNASLLGSFEASLDSALTYSEASYTVRTASIYGFTASETKTIKDTLNLMLTTERGVEILAEDYAGSFGIGIDIYTTSSSIGMVEEGNWPAVTHEFGQIEVDPSALSLFKFEGIGGPETLTLPQVVIHELGHAMTGSPDIGANNNVFTNEDPIRSELGMGYRYSSSTYYVSPNIYSGVSVKGQYMYSPGKHH